MVRTLAVSVITLFVLAGCGSADRSEPDTAGKPEVTATTAPSPTGTPSAPSGEPSVSSASTITVPGLPDQLLVTRQEHPRGGFQLRVFAPKGGAWTELEVDGRPLVPFVATDVQEHPLSIDCTDGGFVVTEAVAHQPAGVAFAWDVRRTTYAVDGTQVTAGQPVEVADNVLPKQLSTTYADLVKHTAFAGC
ncbi:MAG: hypothetical protein JWR90_3718 [Marmoricola sp.]|jgi:hypothetical protein|nr:hypothetical protein [Marmoricola sp.]